MCSTSVRISVALNQLYLTPYIFCHFSILMCNTKSDINRTEISLYTKLREREQDAILGRYGRDRAGKWAHNMGDALNMSVCMKGIILGTPPGQQQMEQSSRPPPAVVMPVSALALLWVFYSQSSSTK